jgi:small-conductance mechanosensitive channel
MTRDEAQRLATQIAESLKWPWDPAAIHVRTWRLWPLPRVWQVRSHVSRDNAVATMQISDRSRKLIQGRVAYVTPSDVRTPTMGWPLLRSVINLLLGEVVVPIYCLFFLVGLVMLLIARHKANAGFQIAGCCLMAPMAAWFAGLFLVVLPVDYVRRTVSRRRSQKGQ